MTPAAIRAARALARRSGDVGDFARIILEAEGLPLDPPETDEEAAERREWERKRKADQRAKRKPVPPCPTDVPPLVPCDVPPVVPGTVARPLSLVSSEILEKEEQRESEIARADEPVPARAPPLVPCDVPPVVPGLGHTEPSSETRLRTPPLARSSAPPRRGPLPPASPSERTVDLTDDITEECAAIADTVGVRDVGSAWLKFCGKYAGKWVNVPGQWQGFCVSWRNNESRETARDLERGRNSAAPLTAEGLDPSSYEASQLRKARQKTEDAAFFEKRLAIARANGEVK